MIGAKLFCGNGELLEIRDPRSDITAEQLKMAYLN